MAEYLPFFLVTQKRGTKNFNIDVIIYGKCLSL